MSNKAVDISNLILLTIDSIIFSKTLTNLKCGMSTATVGYKIILLVTICLCEKYQGYGEL